MKVIDFACCGNVIKLYLGEDNCNDYWGDDWDDAPYEHNAGCVYPEYVKECAEFAFPLRYDVCEACEGYSNSPYSKEDMKNKKVPCIIVVQHIDWKTVETKAEIYFEDDIGEVCKKIVKLGGCLLH